MSSNAPESSQAPSKSPTRIMNYFQFAHLSPPLRGVSEMVCNTARWMDNNLPDGAEKSAGLRKLLEAKDCFVRAAME